MNTDPVFSPNLPAVPLLELSSFSSFPSDSGVSFGLWISPTNDLEPQVVAVQREVGVDPETAFSCTHFVLKAASGGLSERHMAGLLCNRDSSLSFIVFILRRDSAGGKVDFEISCSI